MNNRKQRTAQPMLDPMEIRLAPSSIAISAHQVQAVAAHVDRMHNPAIQAKAGERANNQALNTLKQQEHLVYVHSLERIPSALPTKAEQVATQTSAFMKSLQSAL
jgi:hypothetical protein